MTSLSDLVDAQEGDFFALMTCKEELRTRDGRPYFKVGFRDAGREVTFPVWAESAFANECRDVWMPGEFYKLRATYRETNFGPQLDIRKIRPVVDEDAAEGFDPNMLLPASRYDREGMFDDLLALAQERIADEALRKLVVDLLVQNQPALLVLPAATRFHHAFLGGWLEHVRSVARNAVFLADKYAEHYADLQPPLDKDLVVAGAILHDIGKVREIEQRNEGAEYTPAGALIGHILQGRDMVREAAAASGLDPEKLLRLEHLIVAHQRLPEWGSPIPPMTPEALLVHFADDVDAKFQIMYEVLRDDTSPGALTGRKNVLGQRVYRGGES